MQSVDISGLLRQGANVVALCLTVTNATDGLLDLVKIMGDFSLMQRRGESAYVIAAPRCTIAPAPWSLQGYPFYAGRGVYRRTFDLPEDWAEQRIMLEPAMHDDVLEVVVNGEQAGVRLWAPYGLDITHFLRAGENRIELRVANTLVNLLEGTERLSGLADAPRLVPHREFRFSLAE
jgi:hypothetical protein